MNLRPNSEKNAPGCSFAVPIMYHLAAFRRTADSVPTCCDRHVDEIRSKRVGDKDGVQCAGHVARPQLQRRCSVCLGRCHGAALHPAHYRERLTT